MQVLVWTGKTAGHVLKSEYLSIRSELFGQFNLSGSCSRHQSFVLERMKNVIKKYQQTWIVSQVKCNTRGDRMFDPNKELPEYFFDWCFYLKWNHCVHLPWPEAWRCWLHHLRPSQCRPSSCQSSLWSPLLRWHRPPSLFKSIRTAPHGKSKTLSSTHQVKTDGHRTAVQSHLPCLKTTTWVSPTSVRYTLSQWPISSGVGAVWGSINITLHYGPFLLWFKYQMRPKHNDTHHPGQCYSLHSLA